MKSSKRAESHLTVELLLVESLRESPARVHPRQCTHTFNWLVLVIAIQPGGIGSERCPNTYKKDSIMGRRLGGSAERSNPFHHVWMADGPLKRLLGAHRIPRYQGYLP